SSIDKRDIILKDIDIISDQKAQHVYKVTYTMKAPTEDKDTSKEDVSKMNFKERQEYERKTKDINGQKVKTTEKYISIRVYYDVTLDTYGIYKLPSFTYINEHIIDFKEDSKHHYSRLPRVNDGYVENNL